jgi:hypothetical protein
MNTQRVANLNVTAIFTALFQFGDIVFGMVPQAALPAKGGSINSGCRKGAAPASDVQSDGLTEADLGDVENCSRDPFQKFAQHEQCDDQRRWQ